MVVGFLVALALVAPVVRVLVAVLVVVSHHSTSRPNPRLKTQTPTHVFLQSHTTPYIVFLKFVRFRVSKYTRDVSHARVVIARTPNLLLCFLLSSATRNLHNFHFHLPK